MNSSWPALAAAPKTPITSPRRATNQRFATIGERARDQPGAEAAHDPEQQDRAARTSVATADMAIPLPGQASARPSSRRTPNRSMSHPETGPPEPQEQQQPGRAGDRVWPTVQPVSAWIGEEQRTRRRPRPAPIRMTANATATMTQP